MSGHPRHAAAAYAWSGGVRCVAPPRYACAAGGDYAHIRPRYLHIQYQAVDTAGKILPLEQVVLGLTDQRPNILRVVRRTADGPPQFWDLFAYE